MAENDSSSVVVLLDVSAAGWTSPVASEAGGKLTLKACVEAVVVFINTVQLLDRRNHVALVRAPPHHPGPSPFSRSVCLAHRRRRSVVQRCRARQRIVFIACFRPLMSLSANGV